MASLSRFHMRMLMPKYTSLRPFLVQRFESSSSKTDGNDQPETIQDTGVPPESSSTEKQTEKPGSDEDVRSAVLEASLTMVPEFGFTRQAVVEGATSIGYSSAAHGMFERPEVELIQYFHEKCNKEMVEALQELAKVPTHDKWSSKMEQFLLSALEKRLSLLYPYRRQWMEAKGLMILPQNVCDELKCTGKLVDDIWSAAGCKSVDLSWYRKRAALGIVYHNAELFMLQDDSTEMENTKKYLRSQMADLKWGFGMAEWVGAVTTQAPHFIAGVGSTLARMIGFR